MRADRARAGGRLRLAALAVLLVGASGWLLVGGGPSADELRRIVARTGGWGPVAFVVIYIGWTVALLPAVVPTLAGGAAFGLVAGTLLTVCGAVAGSTVAFLIARRLGRDGVRRLAGEPAARVERWLATRGFLALLYARLVPIVPFNLLNYTAGLSGIPTRAYVAATVVGIVPGTIAYTALGHTAGRPGSAPFVVSLGAVALVTVLAAAAARRRPGAAAAR